jgi:dTDP-glucose pyrophosphorylase
MILWVLESLTLGKDDTLVIVYNPSYMSIGNFMQEVVGDKYPDCKFVELPGPTRGAAETVLFGLKGIPDDIRSRPTLLADGDTFYSSDIVGKFRAVAATHNACFCFNDTQPKPIYSYIKLDDKEDITEVKEKVKISDWANSGCYCFKDGKQLAKECEKLIEANTKQASQDGVGEFYTSGVIAEMLKQKEPFRALKLEVSDIHVLGTPDQVAEFCKVWPTQPRQRFLFDLEGVFIMGFKGKPIERNIAIAQRLKKQGHIIIIQSTRAVDMEKKTWAFLEELKIPCDELHLGKPRADFCIGGPRTVDSILVDLDKTLGFYPTEVKASKVLRKGKGDGKGRPLKKPKTTEVKKLFPDAKGVTCLVKIVDDPKEVETAKKSGPPLKFWECLCGDESGQVVLSMTEAQKEGIAKDKVVFVRNGAVKMVKGHIRLMIDKWGKLEVDSEGHEIEKVGSKNVSDTEYELR